MGVDDHTEHPWLVDEKRFIRTAIDSGKAVLGICLGAQLIADVLGAKVYPNKHKEIGWFPVQRAASAPPLLPESITAFHWHGDTFDLPKNAVLLASSAACHNQAFLYGDRVVALQFHLETTEESLAALIEHCGHELVDAPFIQSPEKILSGRSNIAQINPALFQLLDRISS